MASEAAANADFSQIRYAQCWEDADVLLDALEVQAGDTCLSIASAGDNSLALLTRDPARVVALDLNPSQLACLELRVAAYRELDHPALLELIGSRPSERRTELYQACRPRLGPEVQRFWDSRPEEIALGIGAIGKFERYFELFRTRVLPLVHSRKRIDALLAGGTPAECEEFYETKWNSWRWQLLFRLFFSRFVMGRAGRDPAFFKYVTGSVSDRILERSRYALTELNPAENPYLQWILHGSHPRALPFALRPENFDAIRGNLDRLEWHLASMEDYLASRGKGAPIDRFNLSDIFEYMSEENYHGLLRKILGASRSGTRLAYWNTLADRSRPESMAGELRALTEFSRELHLRDKAFFYCHFVVEEAR
jgi:S-adenosylmethionine-diacylglycerol 3-amino-3-carboxypropyl transferase